MARQRSAQANPTKHRFTFPPSHRLGGRLAFRAVFDNGRKASRGPLTLYALENSLGHPRFGMTVPRRVGKAHQRNRIKRLLREVYRHSRHDLPPFDLVVVVRPHREMGHHAYREILQKLVAKAVARKTE